MRPDNTPNTSIMESSIVLAGHSCCLEGILCHDAYPAFQEECCGLYMNFRPLGDDTVAWDDVPVISLMAARTVSSAFSSGSPGQRRRKE